MTVNNENKNEQNKEITDDSYWKTYFEDETISMDAYKERLHMASIIRNSKKQSSTERLVKKEIEQKSKQIEVIFDR